jgi:clan AA aspartic protease
MRGRVDARAREAVLPLRVLGRAVQRAEVEATVDTGFTGALCLPSELVRALSLPLVGRGVALLADGRTVETPVHRARVVWHGWERVVRVLSTEGGALVGMALLRGSRLTIDAAPGGDVRIEELPG